MANFNQKKRENLIEFTLKKTLKSVMKERLEGQTRAQRQDDFPDKAIISTYFHLPEMGGSIGLLLNASKTRCILHIYSSTIKILKILIWNRLNLLQRWCLISIKPYQIRNKYIPRAALKKMFHHVHTSKIHVLSMLEKMLGFF